MKKVVKKKRRKKIIKILILLILMGIIIFNGYKMLYKDNTKLNDKKKYVYQESVFPSEVSGVKVYTDLTPEGTESRPMTKRIIKYIVIHETDNYVKGVGARNHANYLKNNNTSSTSWHYTVDDKEIYHHIPDDEIAHHAGTKEGNESGIGIELCVNEDGNFSKTMDNAAKLIAYLLDVYNLEIDNVKTHHDFSGKDCPHNILKNNELDDFKKMIENYMEK